MYLPDVVNAVYQLSLKQKIRLLSLLATQIDDETEGYPWDNGNDILQSGLNSPVETEVKMEDLSQVEK